ncbi:MAG: hypothetical protein JKY46_09190 [Robiginitomaculum sp.]|nr:hypothetical protein [Robiginitomaculum sp.]
MLKNDQLILMLQQQGWTPDQVRSDGIYMSSPALSGDPVQSSGQPSKTVVEPERLMLQVLNCPYEPL